MNLPNMGLKEALEMLQDMAERAGVLKSDETLSVDLIGFADMVWAKAYEAGMNDEIERAYHAEMMSPIEDDPDSFVFNPERDGPTEFVPPISLSKVNDLEITIQEIARIALEDDATMRRIGHELDISDEELQRIGQYLNSMLDETNPIK